ncbi:MAG: DUF1566 domain-containing protein [Desulfobacterales bacterium]
MHSFVMKTDQTRCFRSDGTPVDCQGTGQDADVNAGIGWPVPRFTAGMKDSVLDRLTGLEWTQNAALTDVPLTWHEAAEYVEEMNRTLRDSARRWRLPTRSDLFSLISHDTVNPALPEPHPFTNVFNGYYWTGTSCARLPDQAWYVHLGGGRVFKGMKHGSYMVWPVRGSRPRSIENSRFIASGTTILDRQGHLVWQKRADATGAPVSWDSAFSTVEQANRTAADESPPWRLPNIRELESLCDMRFHTPALSANHPFYHVRDGYWSSTSSMIDPAYAWVLYPEDGAVGVGFKKKPEFYVWMVKDA